MEKYWSNVILCKLYLHFNISIFYNTIVLEIRLPENLETSIHLLRKFSATIFLQDSTKIKCYFHYSMCTKYTLTKTFPL